MMPRAREKFVLELASTVDAMFRAGIIDPSAGEIAENHFEGKALAGEIIDSVRKRLHRVRALLEHDFQHSIVLLSEVYYSRFRNSPPQTSAEAYLCLPLGNGKRAEGLWLHTGDEDDIIWRTMISSNYTSGAGKYKKQSDRVLDEVDSGKLAKPVAAEMMDKARQKTLPEKQQLAKELMRGRRKQLKS